MKFEYHAFEVEPFLAEKVQPLFTLAPALGATYYTLSDPSTGSYSITTSNSDIVRIPVFGISTEPGTGVLSKLTHGSLLTSIGIEVAMQLMNKLNLQSPIERVIILLATNCHQLLAGRYRSYVGISIEVVVK